jgi:hypothetical protein
MYNDFAPHNRFSSFRQVFVPSAFHVGFLAVRVATEQVVLLYLCLYNQLFALFHYVFNTLKL